VAQLGARLDGIEEVVGSNPIGSTKKYRSAHILSISLFLGVSPTSLVSGFAALPFLFRFIGEVEFGLLVYDERADEAIRGSGTRDVNGYRQNACYTLLQVENVG
jgi:hypothetical protein